MNPSEHTLNIEQVTPLFRQPDVQSHQNFLSLLKKHDTKRRAELCREKRDELLQSFRSIECLFALYLPVIQKHISKRDGKKWNEFHTVAKEGSRRLNIILKVTQAWGNEVVTHYNFVSRCRDYCENLRAVAWHSNQRQPWANVVGILNASIRIRIQRNDGRSKVSDSQNPILPQDLIYAKRILKGNATFESAEELSEDYGFDQHGLIVRRRFAASSLSSSTFHNSPSRSASQLSSQAQGYIARDSNVTPTPSGQGPPSPSPSLTIPEAMEFATESPSSLRHPHTSPTKYNRSTLTPSTPVPVSSPSSVAPGLRANETSPQSSSSLVEISQTQSISVPAVSPSISHKLLPSSPLTKSRNSEPLLSPPGDFSHDAKSNIIEPPEVSSSVEVTNNPTRSPSTDPNPAFSPPSLSPRSSFHHEATQTMTATSNCRVDGGFNRTMAPCLPTKPEGFKPSTELVRKRAGSNSDESSTKKQKGNDGHPATALVTPLHPLLPASGSHRLDSHAIINSTESTPPSPTFAVNPWLKDAMLSLDRLDQKKWLNDAIINACIHILARRYGFCFLNSHFLQSRSPASGNRKAEYGDPLESDIVLMPIHEDSHWYLLVMYKLPGTGYTTQQDRVVCFLDSLESPLRSYENTFTLWTQYLNDIGCREAVHRRNVKITQQSNNVDCGVFHLAFAYQIVEDCQKFIDAVENGAGLDWAINAPKWRELILVELTSANDNSAVVAEKIIYVESDDDSDVAETARPTTHDSTMARTCPLPPPLRPSPSSWPADTESFGQNVEMGDAGTDADRDGDDEKMLDGSTLIARPLEAVFSSFHPSLAVSTPSQPSGHPPISERTTERRLLVSPVVSRDSLVPRAPTDPNLGTLFSE
ncbi:hypothetical protein MCOR05_008690 [Pyricularia oryzae]|nr:hypothetical protein MCOR05_008690 [Pyricularia oryzae]